MVQNEIPIPTIEYIVRRCHEANVKVLLNPAPAADLDSEWLELATYITPNEHELSALYPNQSTEMCIRDRFIIFLFHYHIGLYRSNQGFTIISHLIDI